MITPIDNMRSDGWFCYGQYLVTVDIGPRLRPPREIVMTLLKNKVTRLWCYPDPTGPRLILCPDGYRSKYAKLATNHFPAGMDKQFAYRKFICSAVHKDVRQQFRIGIAAQFHDTFSVQTGTTLIVVGIGPWYEIWRQDDWDNHNNV